MLRRLTAPSGWTLALLLGAPCLPLAAQDVPPTIASAERLYQAGELEAAADSLGAWLSLNPQDAGVRWRRGQILAEAGRREAAAAEYELALELLPDDPWLRLELGELLLDLEELGRAREVAVPLADAPDAPPAARARALAVLGTAAYWRGDLSRAVRRFEAALDVEPGTESAARQLSEIRGMTRPWGRFAVVAMDDNQPYRRGWADLRAGTFVTPNWTVEARGVPRALDAGTASGAAEAAVTVAGFIPAARLEIEASLGGAWQEGAEESTTWLGRFAARLRLPEGMRLRAQVERERYLWTLDAVDTLLVLDRVELALDRAEAPDWAGEVAVRQETFPDGTTVETAYAWVLAPLPGPLRVGWAASWQDADETRWSPVRERYSPYFTPEEQRIQSVLAEVVLPVGPYPLRIDGRVGVWAKEWAPGELPDFPAALPFYERSYTPWGVRGGTEVPLGPDATVYLEAAHEETAFYSLNRGSVALSLRFGATSER